MRFVLVSLAPRPRLERSAFPVPRTPHNMRRTRFSLAVFSFTQYVAAGLYPAQQTPAKAVGYTSLTFFVSHDRIKTLICVPQY